MSICCAWIRKVNNVEELVFISESRLRSFGSWDCNPKIFTFSRTDCILSFTGNTMFAYPMMIQLKNLIDLNSKIQSRHQKLTIFKGNILKILNDMLKYKSDYELPDVEFLFGGYCWDSQKFRIWKFHYQKGINIFTHAEVNFWKGIKGKLKVVFSGDYIDIAKNNLINLLKEKGKLNNNASLDLEPLEVLRDMLLDSDAEKKYPAIGGPLQMVKVYKSLNRVPFGVLWNINNKEQITLFGNVVKKSNNLGFPIIDPINLNYINTNIYK